MQIDETRGIAAGDFLSRRFAFYTTVLMVSMTTVTFGIAVFTPPLSGPWCEGGCYEYPFTGVVSRFPRDYLWMYPAMLWCLMYVVVMVCVHEYATIGKKIYSLAAVCFSAMSAAVLFTNYFIQVSVIQPSLLRGETDGIAMLTQYNPHGTFIAMEEVGYIIMALSFVFAAPVFSGERSRERAIRWTLSAGFSLAVLALVLISLAYGLHREYRFEIAIISIDWTVCIVAGIQMAMLFSKGRSPQAQGR